MNQFADETLKENLEKQESSIKKVLKAFKDINQANPDFHKLFSLSKEDLKLCKEICQYLEKALSGIKALEFDYKNRLKKGGEL